MKKLDNEVKAIIKDAAKRLIGFKRRAYQAKITLDYFGGSAHRAGWGRESVEKGLKESESGIRCIDNFQGRGRNRTEDNLPNLSEGSSLLLTLINFEQGSTVDLTPFLVNFHC